ncbi:hypothetical protein BDD14_6263 [Edaphobacter modestus]|uniref:Uncharacterized protein n=1 Tax=Edaphobacter modestus TaxID=388466 RepID=A0A4Q7Y187_9BACT|nr:hypothetical protein BDD14_6263 [Edaphobacter modestus]
MPMAANGSITVSARAIRSTSKGCQYTVQPKCIDGGVTTTVMAAKNANHVAGIPFPSCRAANALPNPETTNKPAACLASGRLHGFLYKDCLGFPRSSKRQTQSKWISSP